MIDMATNKIIDCHISKRAKQFMEGSTAKVPGNLEMEGISILASRWRNNHQVQYFIDNNDAKTRAQIQKAGVTSEESLNVNYAVRALTRRVGDFHRQNAKIFTGIKDILIS
jgi:hypothetical protein